MLFNPVFMIGSDILLLTLKLNGAYTIMKAVFINHIIS